MNHKINLPVLHYLRNIFAKPLSLASTYVIAIEIIFSGKPFPDFPLVDLESKLEIRLSDLVIKVGSGPLVLNFGSCS